MPDSKTYPTMGTVSDLARSLIVCAIIAAIFTAIIGGGLTVDGRAEFEFSLSVFSICYLIALFARYTSPYLFEVVITIFGSTLKNFID